MPKILSAHELRPPCSLDGLDFKLSSELPDMESSFAHERAREALRVGLGIRHEGYNIFVVGSHGVGKNRIVLDAVKKQAALETVPNDWCYVANFKESHRPKALSLPAGLGKKLKNQVNQVIEELQTVLPVIFTSDSYTSEVHAITDAAEKIHEKAFEAVKQRAHERQLLLVKDEDGFTFVPAAHGQIIEGQAFDLLPQEKKDEFAKRLEETEAELQAVFGGIPRWQKEVREQLHEHEQKVVEKEVSRLLWPLRKEWKKHPKVIAFFDEAASDILEQIHLFKDEPLDDPAGDSDMDFDFMTSAQKQVKKAEIRRYQVNVLVDHSETEGAPVYSEDIPGFANLIGRIEHLTEFGALITDHTLIKPGALHLASGGYLLLDAGRLVRAPHSWEALKRVLRSHLVRMDPPDGNTSSMTTVTLTPDPISVDVKVILLGSADLYYDLCEIDPEVERFFKVLAAFDERLPKTPENIALIAKRIASKIKSKGILPFNKNAMAKMLEESSRQLEDNEYLSANLSKLFNIVDEAHYWAEAEKASQVTEVHVNQALSAFERRHSSIRDDLMSDMERGNILVETEGSAIGQVNALAVIQLDRFGFGRISRVSATARVGRGEIVDIERESELSGNLHSKGILILQALLGSTYLKEAPLSLSASLTFEQSYGLVDGDSASLAEYCALISAIAEVPIKQSLAMTGSINQRGDVQAIGGVNEKIEAFFDLCARRGLRPELGAGVIIPATNQKNLMLAERVVNAAKAGLFKVHVVHSVSEALSLLVDIPVGERNERGLFPPESLNGKVEARLLRFSEILRRHREWH